MRSMPAIASPPEQRTLLHNISWETYERLLAERIDAPGTRFAYDAGDFEILQVSIGHEGPNRTLARLAWVTAVLTERDCVDVGSTTFLRSDLAKGIEPDSSFYFLQAPQIRPKREIVLPADPPPELVIEVNLTRYSLNRFPIYAAIGVSEIWRYDGERVRFHVLEGAAYQEVQVSSVLPPMSAAQATVFVE